MRRRIEKLLLSCCLEKLEENIKLSLENKLSKFITMIRMIHEFTNLRIYHSTLSKYNNENFLVHLIKIIRQASINWEQLNDETAKY